jgi:hypothetical protein
MVQVLSRIMQSGVTYDETYFPLPLCDGSDPLPWTYAPSECDLSG